MRISIIAAVANNRVIGLDSALPWHLPADLRHFKRLTMGHHLLMGRKTFESLDGPLPGRIIVVITRNSSYRPQGVHTAGSLSDALERAREDEEIFIAGGGEIYSQALPLAHSMYLTQIRYDFRGDTFFPELDVSEWELTERRDYERDSANPYPFSFLTYRRRS